MVAQMDQLRLRLQELPKNIIQGNSNFLSEYTQGIGLTQRSVSPTGANSKITSQRNTTAVKTCTIQIQKINTLLHQNKIQHDRINKAFTDGTLYFEFSSMLCNC